MINDETVKNVTEVGGVRPAEITRRVTVHHLATSSPMSEDPSLEHNDTRSCSLRSNTGLREDTYPCQFLSKFAKFYVEEYSKHNAIRSYFQFK